MRVFGEFLISILDHWHIPPPGVAQTSAVSEGGHPKQRRLHTHMTNHVNEHSAEMFKDYPDIITILDLQAMLHIGRNAAYKLLQDNSIVSIRVGKKYIIPKASVASFITEGVQK